MFSLFCCLVSVDLLDVKKSSNFDFSETKFWISNLMVESSDLYFLVWLAKFSVSFAAVSWSFLSFMTDREERG